MAPTSPSSTPHLLPAVSFSLLLTNAHQLTVPSPSKATTAGILPELVSTLCEALDAIREVASVISTFLVVAGVLRGGDRRLSSTIKDCLDLRGLSSDELSWSMSVASPSTAGAGAAGRVSTGDVHADLRAWLSGALDQVGTHAITGLPPVFSLWGD